MKLPETAAETWRTHRAALHRVADDEAEPSRLLLGGGTILSARWRHRESVDIDVLLAGRRNAYALRPGGRLDLAVAVGGETVQVKEHRITVRTPEGVLDVTTSEPELEGCETAIDVEGRNETVLSTAQILRGKMNRISMALPRDAFDVITAARAEPEALEIAFNSLSAQQRTIVEEHLENANEAIAAGAAEALAGVPDHYRTPPETMGRDAARALRKHEYERVQIHRTRDGITVLTFPRHGTPRALTHGPDARRALMTSGIAEYLDANSTVSSYEAEKALNALAARNETGSVLDTGDADTVAATKAAGLKDGAAPAREAGRAAGGGGRTKDGTPARGGRPPKSPWPA